MNFSSSVDAMSASNRSLRFAVTWLLALLFLACAAIVAMSERAPVYLERSSHGLEILEPTSPARSAEDFRRLAELSVKARFDSRAEATSVLLSARQQELRDMEQSEMKTRGLSQAVVVRGFELESGQAVVDVDRVLAMGEVRSALRSRIRLAFEETAPNELNPYGLKLALAEPLEPKPEAKK